MLSELFNQYVQNVDEDFGNSLKKWKRLFFGCVGSVSQAARRDKEEVFHDLILELVEEREKHRTDLHRYAGRSYIRTDKRLGGYVWIETPSWNKAYFDKRWVLREQLESIAKSSLDSYMYRQICQFKIDYLGKVFTKKNGYTLKDGGIKTVTIKSGVSGTYDKKIIEKVCQRTIRTLGLCDEIGGYGSVVADFVIDYSQDSGKSSELHSLFEVMGNYMSSEALDAVIRTRMLGETLTIPRGKVKIFNREVDLVQRIYEGNDPLDKINTGVFPVQLGMNNVR